tara:strand:- start:1102 stop:1692 length:591 start_codon:yes stop_codon:yes gene_type:complete
MLEQIKQFEDKLCTFTGAPYVIATDCCTHALEICLRYSKPEKITSTAFTYLSVPMLFHKLNITYELTGEEWIGEYKLHGTNIWDSAWQLSPDMYRQGQVQCLSFGNGKPLDAKRGGCILLDNEEQYLIMKRMSMDGRDPNISWKEQDAFILGYHYNMSIEHSIHCSKLLDEYIANEQYQPKAGNHRDCREIRFDIV